MEETGFTDQGLPESREQRQLREAALDGELYVTRRDGLVDEEQVPKLAATYADSRVKSPKIIDMTLWHTLLWSSVAGGVLFTVLSFTRSAPSPVATGIFAFLLLLAMSWMICLLVIGPKRTAADAHRDQVRKEWELSVHRSLLQAAYEAAERAEEKRMQQLLSRPSSPPDPQPYGVSPQGAERIVEVWMRHLGVIDAEVTQYSGDGGIDVASTGWIAQVKHYQGAVGVAAIRELAGVAAVDGRRALFFTSTGYATGAAAFADQAGIGLFTYSAEEGTLTPVNRIAQELDEQGIDLGFTA